MSFTSLRERVLRMISNPAVSPGEALDVLDEIRVAAAKRAIELGIKDTPGFERFAGYKAPLNVVEASRHLIWLGHIVIGRDDHQLGDFVIQPSSFKPVIRKADGTVIEPKSTGYSMAQDSARWRITADHIAEGLNRLAIAAGEGTGSLLDEHGTERNQAPTSRSPKTDDDAADDESASAESTEGKHPLEQKHKAILWIFKEFDEALSRKRIIENLKSEDDKNKIPKSETTINGVLRDLVAWGYVEKVLKSSNYQITESGLNRAPTSFPNQ